MSSQLCKRRGAFEIKFIILRLILLTLKNNSSSTSNYITNINYVTSVTDNAFTKIVIHKQCQQLMPPMMKEIYFDISSKNIKLITCELFVCILSVKTLDSKKYVFVFSHFFISNYNYIVLSSISSKVNYRY